MRLRIHYTDWPRPALELTDTPRPKCADCRGTGGRERHYGHPETGEYDGTDWEFCRCWNPSRAWLLTILPRWVARRLFGRNTDPWATPESPF